MFRPLLTKESYPNLSDETLRRINMHIIDADIRAAKIALVLGAVAFSALIIWMITLGMTGSSHG